MTFTVILTREEIFILINALSDAQADLKANIPDDPRFGGSTRRALEGELRKTTELRDRLLSVQGAAL